MDNNNIIVSGEIGWHKLSMPTGMPFGNLRIKLNLPQFAFTFRGEPMAINTPILWMNISMNMDKSGNFKKADQRILDMIDTNPYVIIRAAKITNWVPKDNGPLQHSVEATPTNVSLFNSTVPTINQCTFEGKVVEYESSGKMVLECQYLAPKTGEWKSRFIPVIHTGTFDPLLTNKKVLLFGSVCSTTPSGDNKLFVATHEINPLN